MLQVQKGRPLGKKMPHKAMKKSELEKRENAGARTREKNKEELVRVRERHTLISSLNARSAKAQREDAGERARCTERERERLALSLSFTQIHIRRSFPAFRLFLLIWGGFN